MNIPVLIGKIAGSAKSIEWKKLLTIYSRLKFSVAIVPSGVSFFKPATYPSWVVMTVLGVYGFIIMLIAALLMVYTPLNSLFFSKTVQLSHYQVNELRKLQQQVRMLDGEVDQLRKQNEGLKNAILTGDSSALKKFDKNQKYGGSIFEALRGLLGQANGESTASGLFFKRPCDGFLSNKFNALDGHYGIDYSVKSGTPVYAAASGYVIFADYDADDGNMVILGHREGFITVYKHCQGLLKRVRQTVLQGEQIGFSGASGRLANGAHLHFEIWEQGVPVDPVKFISQ
jgi:murein DD-endopeptidase MepM/ murein hydrolase activator NlpD